MAVASYHSDVLALLRDDYGVTDAKLDRGGSHPRVTFTYDGEPRHVTLNNKAFSPRAFDMKRQDIRRLLGDPPPRPTRERRTMEEMMSGFNPLPLQALNSSAGDLVTLKMKKEPSVVAQGRMAIYTMGVRFDIPLEVAYAFGATETTPIRIAVVKNDQDLWTITTRTNGHKLPTMHYSYRSKRYEINHPDSADAVPCGLSPAEYLVESGVILVRCPLATRVPLAANAGKQKIHVRRKAVEANDELVSNPEEKTAAEQLRPIPNILITSTPTAFEADIRACLDALRRIEATTPYRLGRRKADGAWCFSAPRIE